MALLLTIIIAFIGIIIFMSAEHSDEYVSKVWCFLIYIACIVIAVYLFEKVVEQDYYDNTHHVYNTDYYYGYDDYY